jgi:hypothetical protein
MHQHHLLQMGTSGILRLLSKLPPDLGIDELMALIAVSPLTQARYDEARSSRCSAGGESDEDGSSLCLLEGIAACFPLTGFSSPPLSGATSRYKE